ncbi:MAG: hypothetical protein HY560_10430 [Gemmatimonadetes bacterium]|nr:hypothetical protein [Gemmatimonadota bacterium]
MTRKAFAVLAVLTVSSAWRPTAEDVVMKAMRDELARTMDRLHLDTLPPPYFVAYRVQDVHSVNASAQFGSLVRSGESRVRRLSVELRVGDYAFDNSSGGGTGAGMGGFPGGLGPLPVEDDYQEVRRRLWLATDAAYKRALEELSQKRAALRNRVRTDSTPDFSRESPATITDSVPSGSLNRPEAEALVRGLSEPFRQASDVFTSSVDWSGEVVHTRYVNSEGTTFTRTAPWVTLRAVASTQAADGAPLDDFVVFYGVRPGDLPGKDSLASAVRALGDGLRRLRQAPVFDQYNGPVLVEGQAAAELFNQVFAPRLLATRRPESPLVEQLGSRVLPVFLNVEDNPTVPVFEGRVIGGYRVDDDGVPARRTSLVERGILKTLLASRVPVRGVPRSTGNRWGSGPVVSNLFVSADSGMSPTDLKRKLLDLAAQRGKPYGIVVRRVANLGVGGLDFSTVMAMMMSGGSAGSGPAIRATHMYRVYPDGREELVRNAEITGLTVSTFKEIIGATSTRVVHIAPFGARGPSPSGPGPGLGYAASYVVPSVLFEDLSLRGPRGEIPRPPVAKHPHFDRP